MKKLIVLLIILGFLAVSPALMAAYVYFNDGAPHSINNGTYQNDYVLLDFFTTNNPGTHLNLVTGGSVMGIGAFGNATVTMSGGTVTTGLGSWDSAAITISGGSVGGSLYAFRSGSFYLYGTGFEINGTALVSGDNLSDFVPLVENGSQDYYTGTITGTLDDGSALDNEFKIYNTGHYEGTGNIYIIPEPATILLFGLGGLLLCGRQRV